jgi:lactate dehydrogenase-like 2-hydroxyacid dehydrogenase
MRLVAFETRDDEMAVFEKSAYEMNLEIQYVDRPLDNNTFRYIKDCPLISVIGKSILDEPLLAKLSQAGVRFISTRSVGYDHIDIKAANAHGIRVSNTHYGPDGVADYTIMLILMLLRKYKQAMWRSNINDYSLVGLQGREIKSLTIGIIGTGSIGARVIQDLTGFGCRIIAHSNSENPAIKKIVEYVSLDALYQQSDVISFHLPLTSKTFHMVNKNSLQKMKDGVILVNCSRGELMNIADITEGIESSKIGALGLDVFENEKDIYHHDLRTDIISNREMAYIRQFPNVILTQHIAFYTHEAVQNMVISSLRDLVSFVEKGECENEILIMDQS